MSTPDPAKTRFIAIQALRWSGLAMAITGLLVIEEKIELPAEIGYGLFLVGLFGALIMPSLLARRWRTPPQ
jgi:hypothetical protein